jgi:hypothetical protein
MGRMVGGHIFDSQNRTYPQFSGLPQASFEPDRAHNSYYEPRPKWAKIAMLHRFIFALFLEKEFSRLACLNGGQEESEGGLEEGKVIARKARERGGFKGEGGKNQLSADRCS